MLQALGRGIFFSNTAKSEKNYARLNFTLEIVKRETLEEKTHKTKAEENMLKYELGSEPAQEALLLTSDGGFTDKQLIHLLEDMGFNMDLTMTEKHYADMTGTVNIGGFVVPGWRNFVNGIGNRFPKMKILLSYKLAPGVQRLHLRVFQQDENSWYIVTHVDESNWMKPDIKGIINSHVKRGAGDYDTGNKFMFNYLNRFIAYLNSDEETFDVHKHMSSVMKRLKLEHWK